MAGTSGAGPRYDAATHALLLGFVFSMIFGHAPTILPAVLGVKLPYRRSFHAPLAPLHGGLMLRVAGDLLPLAPARSSGGLPNVVALVAFALTSVRAVLIQPTVPATPKAA